MESELVETLPRRRGNADPLVGEVPDNPSVEMERRRRWSLIAADVTGPGKTEVPWAVEPLLWKRLEKAAWVTEARRLRGMSALGGEWERLSLLDMMAVLTSGGKWLAFILIADSRSMKATYESQVRWSGPGPKWYDSVCNCRMLGG